MFAMKEVKKKCDTRDGGGGGGSLLPWVAWGGTEDTSSVRKAKT